MKKLFENIEKNRFRLIKESVGGEELVASGMKKVFANAHDTGAKYVSYDQVETVGLGYIKDVSTAQKVAYQCAVQIADKYGYWDDIENERFSKNDGTVDEVDSNQSPKFGQEKDAVLDYLKMIADMPVDEAPPIHVWKKVVENAGIALQHHMRKRGWSGLNENDETNISNPKEKHEVQIGKEILKIVNTVSSLNSNPIVHVRLGDINKLANELIKMHGQQKNSSTKKPMSGWDTLQLGSH